MKYFKCSTENCTEVLCVSDAGMPLAKCPRCSQDNSFVEVDADGNLLVVE